MTLKKLWPREIAWQSKRNFIENIGPYIIIYKLYVKTNWLDTFFSLLLLHICWHACHCLRNPQQTRHIKAKTLSYIVKHTAKESLSTRSIDPVELVPFRVAMAALGCQFHCRMYHICQNVKARRFISCSMNPPQSNIKVTIGFLFQTSFSLYKILKGKLISLL